MIRRVDPISTRWFWVLGGLLCLSATLMSVYAWVDGDFSFKAGGARVICLLLGLAHLALGGLGGYRLLDAEPSAWRSAGRWLAALAGLTGLQMLAGAMDGQGLIQTSFFRASTFMAGLALLFFLGLALIRFILRFGSPVAAVARTLIDEALRMKIALLFIILILATLPILPETLNPSEPLRYRIQKFLSYSLSSIGLYLSLMTIFLACATLCGEIAEKQIFAIAVKPISRTRFLMGKWLGIMLLNGLLLLVSSAAIYSFITLHLARLPAYDAVDEGKLFSEVLVARDTLLPQPGARKDDKGKEIDPEDFLAIIGAAVAKEKAIKDASHLDLLDLGRARWHSIAPRQAETFIFTGLQHAKAHSPYIHLQIEALTGRQLEQNTLKLYFNINDVRHIVTVPIAQRDSFPIPVELIRDDGVLRISIANLDPQANTTINFQPGEGLQLLYLADSFGPNFVRACLIIWLKLSFLAMLGLAAASFLTFPVAALLSILLFLIAWTSPFLMESVRFVPQEIKSALDVVKFLLGYISRAVTTMLYQFGQFDANEMVTDGRLVTWNMVAGCALWIGGLWTGITTVIACLIFSKRELARIQA